MLYSIGDTYCCLLQNKRSFAVYSVVIYPVLLVAIGKKIALKTIALQHPATGIERMHEA